jgi:hypothetical protein
MTRSRRRSAWLGLLLVLLLALGMCGYRLSLTPSASTGPEKGKPSATSSASPSTSVLPPQQTAAPGATVGTGSAGGTQLVLAPAANNSNGVGNCNPESESANCVHHFGVTVGQAPTLYPGLTRALPVIYSNPNNFDIFIKTYRVSVTVPSANAATCPASNLLVPSGTVTLSPTLTTAKNGSVTTTVPIQLAASAPDACQRVRFTVTIDATAVKK